MRRNRRILRITLLGLTLTALDTSAAPLAATRAATKSGPRDRSHDTYASWYGWDFANRRTASGERFDPTALTAAHRTLPLGSKVRVTNLANGRSVVLKITDRGPYHKGRGLDVSREAARQLRMVNQGVAKVRVEQLPLPVDSQPVTIAIAAWPSALDGGRAVSL